jgi:hypothetical protein
MVMPRALVLCSCLAACAPDLRDDYPFDGALPDGEYLVNVAQADGTTLSTVDATHKESFVYVDLDAAEDLPAAEALSGNAWDLSFQRYKIVSNGGSGGPGNVKIAVLKDVDFASVQAAPAEGWEQDGADTVFNAVEGGWYFYDLSKHKLTAREDLTYVVQTGVPQFFKLRMKSYYDENGTAARMQFVWAAVSPP